MQKEIEISKIKIKGNPREDFGDLSGMATSITEIGVIEPVLINKKNELLAGGRRVKASKIAGRKTIPYTVRDLKPEETLEIQLAENIQRKDLNPIEEAKSFNKYCKKTKHSAKHLAKKLGKKEDYVKRRLVLLQLGDKAKVALIKGKIQLGHAEIVARYPEKNQGTMVREIIESEYAVSDFSRYVGYGKSKELKNAAFDMEKGLDGDGKGDTGCSNCQYNGGSQMQFTEAGHSLQKTCLKVSCFVKKESTWIANETKILKAKGISVLSEKKLEAIKYTKYCEHVRTGDKDYKEIVKNLAKNPEAFAVVIEKGYNGIEKNIYCLKPRERQKGKAEKQERTAEDEKILNLSRKEILKKRVADYKRELLVSKTRKYIARKPKQAKVLVLHALLKECSEGIGRGLVLGELNVRKPQWGRAEVRMKKLLGLPDRKLDELIFLLSKSLVDGLYCKEELVGLAKEMNVDLGKAVKKSEVIHKFLKAKLKGKVPKIMCKAGGI